MSLSGDNFQLVFWVAVVPAFVAFGLMVFGVEEPERHQDQKKPRLSFKDASRLSGAFWAVVVLAVVLTLARFSEAFLILRAQSVDLPIAMVPLVLVLMNIVYAFRPIRLVSLPIEQGEWVFSRPVRPF